VNVCETRKIPGVSINQAYQGFLDFTWKKGGGLPVVLLLDKDNPQKRNLFLLGEEVLSKNSTTTHNNDDDDSNNNSNNNNNNSSKEKNNNDEIVQEYKLTKLGPVWKSEIEEGSHTGVVTFTSFEDEEEEEKEGANNNNDGYRHSSSGGTEITWNVSFQTLNRNSLWQSVTESSISDACDNLVCYLSEPLLMTKRVSIRRRRQAQPQPHPQPQQLLNHKVLATEWMEFIWRKGGGLPLPLPPIPLRSDWNDRMIVPPFLIERIVEINETSDYTDIIYTVVNPSIITYPVYTHLGRVRFQSSSLSGRYQQNDSTDSTDDSVMRDKEEDAETFDMIWQVSIRPLNNFILKKFVVFFTETVVSVLARNFKRHIGDIGDDRMDEIDGTLSWGLGDLPDEV